MMLRKALLALLLSLLTALPVGAKPPVFGVAAHSHVLIEWWYINAHITTQKGRHLALVGSFFRFGNGASPLDPSQPMPRAHYLIYAVTDLDKKTHQSYSIADKNMLALLQQAAPLLALEAMPSDQQTRALLASLSHGKLPPGNQLIPGKANVVSAPFHVAYGLDNTLTADNASDTAFTLNLGAGGADTIHLTLSSEKPPMAVGGNGDTGLTKPTDMHYYSLTRCRVGGTINTGSGPEKITGGEGWFDHQWGDSWVAQNDGWDWWGAQLDNGTDVLFFRQRNLATGRIFYPLATFMDKQGHVTVTKNIVFTPDPHAYWTSPKSGVTYPLGWTVSFPDQGLRLHITTTVKNQEMSILGPGGGIWEGSCQVLAQQTGKKIVHGVAYMELVGYGSPAVKAQINSGR